MNGALKFEQIRIGDCWTSPARTVTETDIVNFASMTGDFDRLHVDHEYAATTVFGKPIAHGLLGLAWVAGLGSRSPWVDTLAFLGVEQWQFLRPLYIGDTVHVVTEAVEAQASGRRGGRVRWRRELINQKDEVVQSGIFRTLVARTCIQRSRAPRTVSPANPNKKMVS